jgi:hypothetical protein
MSPIEPIILVRNEVTVGNRFDFWEDVDGESYNFPNGMKGLITEGRPFIYYRGVHRRDSRRGPAEYLGTGVIGEIEEIHLPAYTGKLPTWRCGIEQYIPFPRPVAAKTVDGKYLEQIDRNLWAKVRRIKPELFSKIIRLAGIELAFDPKRTSQDGPPIFPPVDQTTPVLAPPGTVLFKSRPGRGGGVNARGSLKRSRFSKALGDRAEEIALKYLAQTLPPGLSATLRWIARDGETPGWDIQYGPKKGFTAVEVKGTTGKHFSCIEMTAGEWNAARILRKRFFLMLVSECKSATPQIEVIEDPFTFYEEGSITAQPLSWRLGRIIPQ